jgi:hypothetical protein
MEQVEVKVQNVQSAPTPPPNQTSPTPTDVKVRNVGEISPDPQKR